MTAYEFLESKVGYFNPNHPVHICKNEPDWEDIAHWMEEYAELKHKEIYDRTESYKAAIYFPSKSKEETL